MKKEILTLIAGILIGAIIATGVFLVLQSNSSTGAEGGGDMSQMSGEAPDDIGERGEMPDNTTETEDSSNTTSNES